MITKVPARLPENWRWMGTMNECTRALFFAILLSFSHSLFGQGGPIDKQLVVLSSSDAPGVLTQRSVAVCLKQLAQEWKADERSLPKIVIIHVSKQAAQLVSINDKIAVRKNSKVGGETEYFELWIAGEPEIRAIVLALENVLESHFQMQVTDDQRKAVMARVVLVQDSTMEVQQGK